MGRRLRIALLADPGIVNSQYRAYLPLEAVAARGHELHRTTSDGALPLELLLRCDVAFVHRVATPAMQQLARRLRQAGVGIVWDDDDDPTALPPSNPRAAEHRGRKGRDLAAGIATMVRLADVVTTPSERLAERFRTLEGRDVRVLENYLPRAFANAYRPKHEGVVVACLAALEHQVDYEQLRLRETLGRLLDAHPALRVLSLGLRLGIDSDRYESRKGIPFLGLAAELARADIGIAPLVDIPFNRARSNVKLKEYAAGGLAWLASPVGPYRGMGEAQGGRLVPDDGWHDALERLIVDARERRKLAKRGAKWVKGEYVERHAKRWEAALADAAARAQADRGGSRRAA